METKGLSRQKQTDYENIRAYYISKEEIQLTPHQVKIRGYYLEIKAMLLDAKPLTDIVKMMKNDYGVSETTTYRYIKQVKSIFGQLTKADWEFERFFIYEQCKAALVLAKKKENIKGMNAANANLIKMVPEGVDLPDFDKLKQGLYPVILDEPTYQLMQSLLLQTGKTDLTALVEQIGVEDAEIEDLTTD